MTHESVSEAALWQPSLGTDSITGKADVGSWIPELPPPLFPEAEASVIGHCQEMYFMFLYSHRALFQVKSRVGVSDQQSLDHTSVPLLQGRLGKQRRERGTLCKTDSLCQWPSRPWVPSLETCWKLAIVRWLKAVSSGQPRVSDPSILITPEGGLVLLQSWMLLGSWGSSNSLLYHTTSTVSLGPQLPHYTRGRPDVFPKPWKMRVGLEPVFYHATLLWCPDP